MSEEQQKTEAMQNAPETQSNPAPKNPSHISAEDKIDPGIQVLIFLGNFCITPLLGVVLYFVWKDTKPMSAKRVCMLTWIPFVIMLLIALCYIAFVFLIAGSASVSTITYP